MTFLEDSAVPSINFLLRQITFIEFLISDFERKLKEYFILNDNVILLQTAGKLKEANKLTILMEKASKNAEYSGINLRNKLQ